jgi:hypothetical protein
VTSGARLRERDVIDAEVAALREVDPMGGSSGARWRRCNGCWKAGPGPVTGEVGGRPTAARVIVHELAAAEALIYGARSERAGYAQGVEHALMWAQFATCSTPAPEVRPQRGRGAA